MMPVSRSFFLALFHRVGKERFVVGFDLVEDVMAEFVGEFEDQNCFGVTGLQEDSFVVFAGEG